MIIQYSSRNTGTTQLEKEETLNKLKIQQTHPCSLYTVGRLTSISHVDIPKMIMDSSKNVISIKEFDMPVRVKRPID